MHAELLFSVGQCDQKEERVLAVYGVYKNTN